MSGGRKALPPGRRSKRGRAVTSWRVNDGDPELQGPLVGSCEDSQTGPHKGGRGRGHLAEKPGATAGGQGPAPQPHPWAHLPPTLGHPAKQLPALSRETGAWAAVPEMANLHTGHRDKQRGDRETGGGVYDG